MVRGPVLDERTGIVRNTLHWSPSVRNVPRNEADLQYRLRSKVMVRRLKTEVLTELPDVQWHAFPLSLDAAMRKALKHPGWEKAKRLYEMDVAAFSSGAFIDGEISTARRELGEAKAPAVAAYIEELLREGVTKIVVSAWHLSVLAYLRERLKRHGVVYMDGSTPPKKKQAAVDAFQGDDGWDWDTSGKFDGVGPRIILGQMRPLGEGWTLTAAQDVVFAEPDWVPGKNAQLLDRINRYGQEGDYTIGHVPLVPDSMDERILGTAIRKDKHIHAALDKED